MTLNSDSVYWRCGMSRFSWLVACSRNLRACSRAGCLCRWPAHYRCARARSLANPGGLVLGLALPQAWPEPRRQAGLRRREAARGPRSAGLGMPPPLLVGPEPADCFRAKHGESGLQSLEGGRQGVALTTLMVPTDHQSITQAKDHFQSASTLVSISAVATAEMAVRHARVPVGSSVAIVPPTACCSGTADTMPLAHSKYWDAEDVEADTGAAWLALLATAHTR